MLRKKRVERKQMFAALVLFGPPNFAEKREKSGKNSDVCCS